jgi:Domain of unknown function (DUF4167)
VFTGQPPQNTKVMTNAMLRRSNPTRRNQPTGVVRARAGNVQSFQRNYDRYLSLARAEALAGDRIAAENYFQHAEHYFRAIRESQN